MIDRFVCRREGHIPALVFTQTGGIPIASYITCCQRCGKTIEVKVDPPARSGEKRMSADNTAKEARRRIDQAASILASAIRLGGDAEYARIAMASAVRKGAEQCAEDTVEAYEGVARP